MSAGVIGSVIRRHRRAGDPHRIAPRHAHAGATVRHGPHDRGGAGARRPAARATASTCWAKRRRRTLTLNATGSPISMRSAPSVAPRQGSGPIAGPGISVKLSALHPRYEPLQAARCVPALIGTLTGLALAAKAADIGLTVDAEEADRLEISLDIFSAVLADPRLAGWDGLGLAVQAYQKRALPLIDWVAALGRRTRPSHSDAAGERRLLGQRDQAGAGAGPCRLSGVHPQGRDRRELARLRAPHAGVPRRDLSRVRHAQRAQPGLRPGMRGEAEFEMQRLHGMGEALYHDAAYPVRVYAPVGTHEDLLAYLVRRLLENGANTSFVHRLVDPSVPEEAIVADPVARLRALGAAATRAFRCRAISIRTAINSAGVDLADRATASGTARRDPPARRSRDAPAAREIRNPADRRVVVGAMDDAGPAEIDAAARRARARLARVGHGRRCASCRGAGARRRSDRGGARRTAVPAGARRRQDIGRRYRGNPRGRRLLPLVCAACAHGLRRAARAVGTDRRAEHLGAGRAWRVRRHLAVELPAGDLHRPGRRRARRRQCGGRQTGRADAAGRGPRRRHCCSRPACRGRHWRCCLATGRSARRW